MLRAQHNETYHVNRAADETVIPMSYGGETAQYDGRCESCWLGHNHTWEKHDAAITRYERDKADCLARHDKAFAAYERSGVMLANMQIYWGAETTIVRKLLTLHAKRFYAYVAIDKALQFHYWR